MATVGRMSNRGTYCKYDDGDRQYHDLYEEEYKVMGFMEKTNIQKKTIKSKSSLPDTNYDTIRNELQCSICLDVMKDAVTIKACMHSFCETCIGHQISTNKCCPLCKIHVNSHRDFLANQTMRNLANIFKKTEDSTYVQVKLKFNTKQSNDKKFRCSLCNGFKTSAAQKCTGMCGA